MRKDQLPGLRRRTKALGHALLNVSSLGFGLQQSAGRGRYTIAIRRRTSGSAGLENIEQVCLMSIPSPPSRQVPCSPSVSSRVTNSHNRILFHGELVISFEANVEPSATGIIRCEDLPRFHTAEAEDTVFVPPRHEETSNPSSYIQRIPMASRVQQLV
jgi:hypothetical protein